MIRLVLFDIDGTLIRTGGAGVSAFTRTVEEEFGIRNGTREMRFAGRTDPSLVREIFTRHGVEPSAANFERFYECYLGLLQGCLAERDGCVCPGVERFIDGLQALDSPPVLGLQTGNIRRGAEIKLRHYGLWERFVTGGFGDDDEDRNRLARVAHERGRELLNPGLAGTEILVVGDTPFDIECGRAIGARVLAVGTGGATLAELEAHRPDWVVPDLTHAEAARVAGDVS